MGCNYSFISQFKCVSTHGSILISSENCGWYHLSMSHYLLIRVNKRIPMTVIVAQPLQCYPLPIVIGLHEHANRLENTWHQPHTTRRIRSRRPVAYKLACHVYQAHIHDHHDDVIKWSIFRVTGPSCGEFTVHRWIPLERLVTRIFDVFFDLHLNKRLSQ